MPYFVVSSITSVLRYGIVASIFLMQLLFPATLANEIDKEEMELLQKGYIFYPPRIVTKVPLRAEKKEIESNRTEAKKELDNLSIQKAAEISVLKKQNEQKINEEIERQQTLIKLQQDAEDLIKRQAAEIARLKQEQEAREQEDVAAKQALIKSRREAEEIAAKQAAEIARLKQEQEAKEKEDVAAKQALIKSRREAEEIAARQAAEIARLKQDQETTDKRTAKTNEQKNIAVTSLSTSSLEKNSLHSRNDKTVTGSTGSVTSVGYAHFMNDSFRGRLDFVTKPNARGYKEIYENLYIEQDRYSRIGTYIDWFPHNINYSITAGISINDISSSRILSNRSDAKINDKPIAVGSGDLSIKLKMPRVSPYFGLGYESSISNDSGWTGFARIGFLIASPKINANTNLLGTNGITQDDLLVEIDRVKKSTYRFSLIPEASLGLAYKF